MPANLDITNGVASFVSANTPGWHQLGTTLPKEALTAEEALTYGHLANWNVRKVPIYAQTEFGRLEVPGRRAVVRDNPIIPGQIDVIGDVSESYGIVQNEAHVDFLNALVDESGALFDTAGALDENGRRVFVTMKLPGHIKIGGVDPIENHIAALNSHDGSTAFSVMVTPIRIVCGNTWNMAVRNHSHIFKVRHTSNAMKGIVAAARQALDLTFEYIEGVQEIGEIMINSPLPQSRFEEIIAKEFGAPEDAPAAVQTRADRRLAEMNKLFADAVTQEGVRETVWAGLNALTEWNDHLSPARGDDPALSRARRSILDPSFKNRAFDLMLAEVK